MDGFVWFLLLCVWLIGYDLVCGMLAFLFMVLLLWCCFVRVCLALVCGFAVLLVVSLFGLWIVCCAFVLVILGLLFVVCTLGFCLLGVYFVGLFICLGCCLLGGLFCLLLYVWCLGFVNLVGLGVVYVDCVVFVVCYVLVGLLLCVWLLVYFDGCYVGSLLFMVTWMLELLNSWFVLVDRVTLCGRFVWICLLFWYCWLVNLVYLLLIVR